MYMPPYQSYFEWIHFRFPALLDPYLSTLNRRLAHAGICVKTVCPMRAAHVSGRTRMCDMWTNHGRAGQKGAEPTAPGAERACVQIVLAVSCPPSPASCYFNWFYVRIVHRVAVKERNRCFNFKGGTLWAACLYFHTEFCHPGTVNTPS